MKKKLNYENVVHVDKETGEIICETNGVTTIEDSELTEEEIRKQQFLEKYDPNFNKGARFVKLYDGVLEALTEKLSKAELVFMLKIVKLVSYDDCILRTNGHGHGKILDLTDIADAVGENYKNCSKLMNGLIKKGVIGKHETGCVENPDITVKCYTFNPFIISRGVKLNRTIIALFENTGWKELSCNYIATEV